MNNSGFGLRAAAGRGAGWALGPQWRDCPYGLPDPPDRNSGAKIHNFYGTIAKKSGWA